MSDYGNWWCSYTSIKTIKWNIIYNQEMLDENTYKLEKCKEDCLNYEKEKEMYKKRLEKCKNRLEIAEKKCSLWEEIQRLHKLEKEK